jgi:hypothetical protein
MLNFVVRELYAEQLKGDGVTTFEETKESEFGKSGWIPDTEQNKIKLGSRLNRQERFKIHQCHHHHRRRHHQG